MNTEIQANHSPAITQIKLPGIDPVRSGKVREVYDAGDAYLFVASDRISAFDCIMPTGIPGKGYVLNQLSAFWFNKLEQIVPNHVVSMDTARYPDEFAPYAALLKGRSMLVRKAEMFPIECVARGYLAGSGWKDYNSTGGLAGNPLPGGLEQSCRLSEPLFTPATKAESGHDINISFDEMANTIGSDTAGRLRDITMQLYSAAAEHAADQGIIIADTKFEFGQVDGEIVWADEALTPDSSRFWPADQYKIGISPPSFDKQFLRDYLETLSWDKTPPAPVLPDIIVSRTQEKYLEAYRLLTGSELRW
jgi:phosphoribosylaminoimidazole-succinocarboxamide synthase